MEVMTTRNARAWLSLAVVVVVMGLLLFGATRSITVDVRLIAATHRDLEAPPGSVSIQRSLGRLSGGPYVAACRRSRAPCARQPLMPEVRSHWVPRDKRVTTRKEEMAC